MSSLEKPAGPPSTGDHHNRWLVLAIVCFGQLMVILDATIVNVALPAIQADLDLTDAGLQWIVNGYTLAFGGFLLLGGRLGDIYGRKSIFVVGVSVFTFASLLNGLAQSQEWLVGARALQGLGGALLSPAALSIIATEFHGPDRAKAMSVWGAIAGLGAALGLLVGGVLVEYASWEWIFFVNVPVGIVVIALAVSQIVESRAEDRPALDVAGAFTATAGLVALVFGITQTASKGWGSATVLISLGLAVVLLGTFIFVEQRHRDPLVPLHIFKVRSVSAANSVGLLAFAAIFPFFFFLSLFMQQVLGYDALKTGFAFLPFSVSIIITATLASQAVPKLGVRKSSMIGTGAAFIGMAAFGLALSPTLAYFPGVFIPMVFLAIGMGMVFVPLTFLATSKVPAGEAGLASGLFNTTQQVGGALGLAILATLAHDRTTSALLEKSAAAGVTPPANAAEAAAAPANVQAIFADALVSGWSLAFLIGAGLIVLGFIAGLVLIHDEDADLEAGPAHIG